VEVQIIGDLLGNVVHLGDRDCSVQRRNQKVLEEAPAPRLDDAVRAGLHDDAVKLARHVGYSNAGTVEFMVGNDGTVSFLEVNTRLQVEHPVTEAVTGVDLVELQLRVAAGEQLPIRQQDVAIRGHAIEARLVAENPASGWLPSTGELKVFRIAPGARVDTGVAEGSVVTPDYDSLLAKVIVHADSRDSAASVLARVLRESEIVGVQTNVSALTALLEHAEFVASRLTTQFLVDHPELQIATGADGDDRLALVVAAAFDRRRRDRAADPHWRFAPSGWRNLPTHGHRESWLDLGTAATYELEIGADTSTGTGILIGSPPDYDEGGRTEPDERREIVVKVLRWDDDAMTVELDGVARSVRLSGRGEEVTATSAAGSITVALAPRFQNRDAASSSGGPHAPLPGTIVAVRVAEGQLVEKGDVLVVLEAMKMEHTLTAPMRAHVGTVHIAVGDRVEEGVLLLDLFEHEDDDAPEKTK
jgi:propionyl-CoA carboxylase alpha chain